MSDLDLSEAIEAAAPALWAATFEDELAPPAWEDVDANDAANCRDVTRLVLQAAAPVIVAAVREQIAREIRAFAPEAAANGDTPDAVLGLLCAATIADQKPLTADQLADQLDTALSGGQAANQREGTK